MIWLQPGNKRNIVEINDNSGKRLQSVCLRLACFFSDVAFWLFTSIIKKSNVSSRTGIEWGQPGKQNWSVNTIQKISLLPGTSIQCSCKGFFCASRNSALINSLHQAVSGLISISMKLMPDRLRDELHTRRAHDSLWLLTKNSESTQSALCIHKWSQPTWDQKHFFF